MSTGTLPSDISIRETTCADADPLRRMFYRLSPTSVYHWLAIGAPHTPHFADRLVAFALGDGITQAAVVAWHGDEIVGVACYVCADGERADAAIIVEDAWQGRAIGWHLGLALARLGLARGIRVVSADILAENQRAIKLAKRLLPAARRDWSQGECHIEGNLAAVVAETTPSNAISAEELRPVPT